MCIYHEALRNLTSWWRENGVDGVQEREVALALVVLPAKEKGHTFLDRFPCGVGDDSLWQVRTLRKLAFACKNGLIDQIRDLPDELWEQGLRRILPALQAASPKQDRTSFGVATIFSEMMLLPGLSVDEILTIGVLQGVKPRTTCLQWYKDHEGESGREWPIPLLEQLAKQVFGRRLLERFDDLPLSGVALAIGLVRDAIAGRTTQVASVPKRDCCGGS